MITNEGMRNTETKDWHGKRWTDKEWSKNTGLNRHGLINTCNTGEQGQSQEKDKGKKWKQWRQNYEIKQEITKPKTQNTHHLFCILKAPSLFYTVSSGVFPGVTVQWTQGRWCTCQKRFIVSLFFQSQRDCFQSIRVYVAPLVVTIAYVYIHLKISCVWPCFPFLFLPQGGRWCRQVKICTASENVKRSDRGIKMTENQMKKFSYL